MVNISWAEGVQLPVESAKLEEVVSTFIKELGHERREVSVYLTGDEEIQGLNLNHRGLDQPTDILSWSYWEDDPDSEVLGELAVSVDRVQEQAQSNGWDAATELIRLLAHGCAHLVGYDHERSPEEERIMLGVEVKLLHQVGLSHVYPEQLTQQ